MSPSGSGGDTSPQLIERNVTEAVLVLAVLATVVVSAWSVSAPSTTPPGEVPVVYVLPPVAASIVASIAAGIAYATVRNMAQGTDSAGGDDGRAVELDRDLDDLAQRDRVAELERVVARLEGEIEKLGTQNASRDRTASRSDRDESDPGREDPRFTDPGGYPSGNEDAGHSTDFDSRSADAGQPTESSADDRDAPSQSDTEERTDGETENPSETEAGRQPYRGDDREPTSAEQAVDEWRSKPRDY